MLLEEFDVKKYERTLRGEGREAGREEGIRIMLESLREVDCSRNAAKDKLMEKYHLTREGAEEKLVLYWK